MRIQAKIRGTRPILFHSGALVDPQNEYTQAIKKVSAKRPKTDADHAEIARLEYLGAFYIGDGGKIVMPDVNLMATIIEGAKKFKKGPAAKAGVFIDRHGVFDFSHKGDKSPKALWESGKFADRRRVTIQRNSIIRVRPRFNDWSCEFELELDEEICDLGDVRQWLETAGNRSGLGDYRPMYGRFEVMEFKAEKSI